MENNKLVKEIYEHKGVFGDEEKFGESADRLEAMLHFVKFIQIPPTEILDLGGGTGYFSHLIKKTYPDAHIECADISNTALEIGSKKYPEVNFVFADSEEELPFSDSQFDLIISGEQIEHLADVDTYLSEINRVLKVGGGFIITTPNLGSWLNRLLLLIGIQPLFLEPSLKKVLPLFSIFGKTFPSDLSIHPAGHLRLYTNSMLKRLLRHYGLDPVKVAGTALLNKPILKIVDKLFSFIPSLASGIIMLSIKRN